MTKGGNKRKSDGSRHTIIVPTDFTPGCTNAALYAEKLLGIKQHKLILINTYENPDTKAVLLVSLHDILAKESKKKLKLQSENIRAKLSDPSADIFTLSEEGGIKIAIQHITEKEKVDLLSVSIHDHSTYSGPLRLRIPFTLKPHPPILLVPENLRFNPPKKIALIASQNLIPRKTSNDLLDAIIKRNKSKVEIIETEDDTKPGTLSTKIKTLVVSGKYDMAVIYVSAGDAIDKILQGHLIDELYSVIPTLLIRHT